MKVEAHAVTSEELIIVIVVVSVRVPPPGLGALKHGGKEVTSAIFIEWDALMGGPSEVPGRFGCVAMTPLGKMGTIGVRTPVSVQRPPDAAPEAEARARLAGVMLGNSMPGTSARLLETTGPGSMAVAGRVAVETVAGVIFLGCILSSAFAHLYIAEGIL